MVLNKGVRNAKGNKAIISAGTGPGEAGMYWDEEVHRPFASEGGQVDLAPRNHIEMELLDYPMNRYRRVSYERLISGLGLVQVYQSVRDTGKGEEPPWLGKSSAMATRLQSSLSTPWTERTPCAARSLRVLRVSLQC